jgi:hypothetical protein
VASYLNKWSLIAAWLLALTVALSVAAGTISLAAWVGLALIGLMPPVMLIMFFNTPERTTAEIIRDVEAGRSR